jgi:hypothetical protein
MAMVRKKAVLLIMKNGDDDDDEMGDTFTIMNFQARTYV